MPANSEPNQQNTEALLRQVINASPSMIFVKDWDGHFVLVNKSLADCYGTTINEIVGKTDADFNSNAQEVAHFLQDDREVMTTKREKYITEEPVTCADGRARWFTTIKLPLVDPDGSCNKVLGVATDMTDRKRIEDALFFIAQRSWKAAGEDFFASVTKYLAQSTGVDYAFIGRLKEGNEIVQTVALCAKTQIQPNIEYKLEHTPCHNVVGQTLRSYTADMQQLFPLDSLLRELSIESYIGMPLWDSNHQPIGLISVMHSKPIANPEPVESLLQLVAVRAAGELERRKADEQLQFQLELTRKIADTAAVCIFVTDANGYVTFINPEAEKVFGFSLADLKQKPLHDVIHHHYPDGRPFPVAECPIGSIFIGGEPFRGYEAVYFRKDGSGVPVISSSMPIFTEGKTVGAVLVILDITERKRAEETLRESESRLFAQTKELETIISIVSHDLRSPLMNVRGFNRFIKDDCIKIHKLLSSFNIPDDARSQLDSILDKSMIEATGFIETSAGAMNNLVETLVKVARAGLVIPHPEKLDMNKLLADVVASIKIKFKDTGATIEINDLPPCFADKMHVAQIFTNLIDNAVKYLDPNRQGMICVSGRIQNSHTLYQVADNGIGIAPEYQEKVFDAYYRITEKKLVGGEGVGLSVVKRMVERNNGRIWLISDKDKGSNFFIALPVSD